jgi:predicted RNA-binding Zn ribbon-like protein
MRYAQRTIPPAKLAREELCIRFVNTVAWRLADHPEDRVDTADKLLSWFAEAGLVEPAEMRRLNARWGRAPREASLFLKRAVGLREAAYSLLLARIKNSRVDARSLGLINGYLTSPRGLQLAAARNGLKWRLSYAEADGPLGAIAWSAASLLMGPRATRLRQCQDERGCGWLFLDESRAQNRRWCSMGDCGNRAKSRRHYRRATGLRAKQPRPRRE